MPATGGVAPVVSGGDVPINDPKTSRRFQPPLLLIKEHQDLHSDVWQDGYLAFKNGIVGFSALGDVALLISVAEWLDREHVALKAYVAGISTRLFTQRATAVFNADIFALPFPEDGNLDLSANERILTDDIVTFQRDFIRLGTRARLMHSAPVDALEQFDSTLLDQINAVYGRNPLRALRSIIGPARFVRLMSWVMDRSTVHMPKRYGISLTAFCTNAAGPASRSPGSPVFTIRVSSFC